MSLDKTTVISILDYVVAMASLQIWLWCWTNVYVYLNIAVQYLVQLSLLPTNSC